MKLYGGIDLHSNNNYLVVIDEKDHVQYRQRLANAREVVLGALEPFKGQLEGIVVESTYNWYGLVDALMAAGYRVHLANTAEIEQYSGLKHSDDPHDAWWLAHLLRLGLLAEGYIYPAQERPLRDLLRKRSHLVRQRTANLLSLENLIARTSGARPSGQQVKQLTVDEIQQKFSPPELALAMTSPLSIIEVLNDQIGRLEKAVRAKAQLQAGFRPLMTVYGIGEILALTIMLEAGEMRRFPSVGDWASYCRCVRSQKLSNGRKKGEGNRKNGNKYLAWAFREAAHFAVQHYELARRFYQRKRSRTNAVVAIKALAHKLARASYYVLRDQGSFDPARLLA
jgi:transposase